MKASPARPALHAAITGAAMIATALTLLTGCASRSAVSTATEGSSTPAAGSALGRWDRAYSYLSAQTKPTEITCIWFDGRLDGHPAPLLRPTRFFSFTDSAAWRRHAVTRWDPTPRGVFEVCEATVPTTVPYGPAIASFLAPRGLYFGGDPAHARGLLPIEIAYAGENASDPDIIYRDRPGLFGLRLALAPLGQMAFEPGTERLIPPRDDATAAYYLRFAQPLLRWYGFTG